MDIGALGSDYQAPPLERQQLRDDPMGQLAEWLAAAVQAGVREPNAMALATAAPGGRSSVRMVLAKSIDASGITFYTHDQSRKAQDMAANPWAAVTFFWPALHRQVIACGAVARISPDVAERYWSQRPRGSQLGAWASHQDEVLLDREVLEQRLVEVTQRFSGRPVPMPESWVGFHIAVEHLEVWQGRPDRLHDRFQYRLDGSLWVVERLSP